MGRLTDSLINEVFGGGNKSLATQERRAEEERFKWLNDANKLDTRVAESLREQLHPEARIRNTERFPTKTDAVQAAFPKGDPRANMGTELKRDTRLLMQNGADPDEAFMVAEQFHKSKRAEDTYKFIRREDTALPMLGKKVGRMEGYDQWLEGTRVAEGEAETFGSKADLVNDAPENFAIGAGFQAAMIGLRAAAPIIGRTAMAVPHPLAKIVGAGLMAVPTFWAAEKASEAVAGTEWAKARQTPGEFDRADAAELAVNLGGFIAAEKALQKTGASAVKRVVTKLAENDVKNRAVLEQLARFPSARNTLDAIAEQRSQAALEREIKRGAYETEFNKLVEDETRSKLLGILKGAEGKRQAEVDAATSFLEPERVLPVARPIERGAAKPRKVKPGEDMAGAIDAKFESMADKDAKLAAFARKAKIEEIEDVIARVEKGEEALQAAEAASKTQRDIDRYYSSVRGSQAEAVREAGQEVGARLVTPTVKDVASTLAKWDKEAAASVGKTPVILRKKTPGGEIVESARKNLATEEKAAASVAEATASEQEKIIKSVSSTARQSLGESIKDEQTRTISKAIENGLSPEKQVKDIRAAFSRENPPPFTQVLEGKLDVEDYVKMMDETPGLAGTEFDFLRLHARDDVSGKLQKLYNEVQVKAAEFRGGKGRGEMKAEPRAPKVQDAGADTVDMELLGRAEKGPGVGKKLAVAGVATGISALLSVVGPNDSDAAIIPPEFLGKVSKGVVEMTKAAGKGSREGLLKEWEKAGWTPPKVNPKEPFKVQGFMQTPKMAPAAENIKRKTWLPVAMDRWLSPHTRAEMYYDKFTNPLVELHAKTVAAINNTDHSMEVLGNILREVPEVLGNKKAFTTIKTTMKELDSTYANIVDERGFRTAKKNLLERDIARVKSRLEKGKGVKEDLQAEIAVYESQLREHAEALPGLEKQFGEYKVKWQTKVRSLAAEFPTTRIALAVEDTADFAAYPWLKGMMSRQELAATARIKDMMKDYGAELTKVGEKVITEKPYIHHAVHPERDFRETKKFFEKLAGGNADEALRLAKLHHRTEGSLQMMPDTEYIMSRYLPDVNKRLQYIQFWDKKNPTGWAKHSNSATIRNSPALSQFWRDVKASFDPHEGGTLDEWARRYHGLEVARLLWMSPSVAFKHMMKVTATMSSIDFPVTQAALPRSSKAPLRLIARDYLKKSGLKVNPSFEDEIVDGFIKQNHFLENISGFEASNLPSKWIDDAVETWNKHGSLPVRLVENFDRAHTFLSSVEMAARKGMTPDQALFATTKMILQDNFIGGMQNPSWLKSPKARAFLMFQGTPFKIFERRLMLAMQSGKALTKATQEAMDLAKNIRQYVKEGELEFKASLVMDALKSESNVFGVPTTKVLMKEILLVGALVGGGHAFLDSDFAPLALHQPFVESGGDQPGIRLNPLASASWRAWNQRQEGDEDWLFSKIVQNYIGGTGAAPALFRKMSRLSKGDIPEMYLDARYPELNYIFAVPAEGAGH